MPLAFRLGLIICAFLHVNSLVPMSQDYHSYVYQGIYEFKQQKFDKSVASFDKAAKIKPDMIPYLWQRGLAYYYHDQFENCAKQFEVDVSVNPFDTEEAIWDVLCKAELLGGYDKAKDQLINIENERRLVMRVVYNLFDNKASVADLERISGNDKDSSVFFYSRLYLSLYSFACGDKAASQKYITEAISSKYCVENDRDLMTSVARAQYAKLVTL